MARRERLALSVIATLLVAAAGAAETVRIVADRAEVRREASAGGNILGTVSKGTVLQVLGREGGWVQVAYSIGNGAFYAGYVPAVFCEDARGAAPSTAEPVAPAPPASVNAAPAPAPAPVAAPVPAVPTPHQTASGGQKSDVKVLKTEATQPLKRLSVFVITASELQNGFAEKEAADSRKDLEEKLRQGRKHVSLADSRESAHLLLA
jgi:hypothetical protein